MHMLYCELSSIIPIYFYRALPGDEDPDVAKRLKAIEAAVMALTQPSGPTATQCTASMAEVCRKFNFSECKFNANLSIAALPRGALTLPHSANHPSRAGGPHWGVDPRRQAPLLAERTQGLVPLFCCRITVVSVLLCWLTHLRFVDDICG